MQHLLGVITRTRLVKEIIFAGKPVLKILLSGDGGGEGGGGCRGLPLDRVWFLSSLS